MTERVADKDREEADGTATAAHTKKTGRVGPMAKDALGDRIKRYEAAEGGRRAMPGLPIVVRIDGRSFSGFTRGMGRPYDQGLADLMVEVTKHVVHETHALVGYTQSDEASFVLDPFGKKEAELAAQDGGADSEAFPDDTGFFFDGRYQKLASAVAAMATSKFMVGALDLWPARARRLLPGFDARVFQVPNRREAVAALMWRELDATKNAVSMAARAHFSHAGMDNRSGREMQEMLFQRKGINFNDYPARFKRGVYVQRRRGARELDAAELARIPIGRRPDGPVMRSEIAVLDLPPLSRIRNKVDVLLNGAEPVLLAPAG